MKRKAFDSRRTHFFQSTRLGTIWLELIGFLVMYSILLALAPSLAAVNRATIGAKNEARRLAWIARNSPNAATTSLGIDTRSLGRLLRQQSSAVDAGLIERNAAQQVAPVFPILTNGIAPPERTHAVTTGTWNHTQLAFSQAEPLSLDPMVQTFAPMPLGVFRQLLNVGF